MVFFAGVAPGVYCVWYWPLVIASNRLLVVDGASYGLVVFEDRASAAVSGALSSVPTFAGSTNSAFAIVQFKMSDLNGRNIADRRCPDRRW